MSDNIDQETVVQVVELPRMRVAVVHAEGAEPEPAAWEKMIAWAQQHGLVADDKTAPAGRRVFGHNNPDPSPAKPEYGYDFMITVDESVKTDTVARVMEIGGGQYAVMTLELDGDPSGIYTGWEKLFGWVKNSDYRPESGVRQWYEEHFFDGMQRMDLYMPVSGG